jgi:hypothetical protein
MTRHLPLKDSLWNRVARQYLGTANIGLIRQRRIDKSAFTVIKLVLLRR